MENSIPQAVYERKSTHFVALLSSYELCEGTIVAKAFRFLRQGLRWLHFERSLAHFSTALRVLSVSGNKGFPIRERFRSDLTVYEQAVTDRWIGKDECCTRDGDRVV